MWIWILKANTLNDSFDKIDVFDYYYYYYYYDGSLLNVPSCVALKGGDNFGNQNPDQLG